MRFSAKNDIDVPAAYVFAALSDFDAWELTAMRRGVEVVRTDKLPSRAAGMSWHLAFGFRGRTRKVDMRLVKIQPETRLELAALSPAVDASLVFDVVAMSAQRSRVHVVADVTPLTLTAKLFIQSLRLARARVDRRYSARISAMLTEIETRYKNEQMPS